jgi:hypothetical protein
MDNNGHRPTDGERRELASELLAYLLRAHDQAFDILYDDVVAKHLAAAAYRLQSRFGFEKAQDCGESEPLGLARDAVGAAVAAPQEGSRMAAAGAGTEWADAIDAEVGKLLAAVRAATREPQKREAAG